MLAFWLQLRHALHYGHQFALAKWQLVLLDPLVIIGITEGQR